MKLLLTVDDDATCRRLLARLREHGVPATSVDHRPWGAPFEAGIYVLCAEHFEEGRALVQEEAYRRAG